MKGSAMFKGKGRKRDRQGQGRKARAESTRKKGKEAAWDVRYESKPVQTNQTTATGKEEERGPLVCAGRR